MNGRNTVARILVVLGAIGWFTSAVFHLKDYAKDTAKLSPLSAPLQAGFRTIFLMVGWDWIVIAIVALLAAFTQTTLRKVLVLFCGVAGLVQAALALALMGVFLGTELMFPASTFLIIGGLLFRSSIGGVKTFALQGSSLPRRPELDWPREKCLQCDPIAADE